MRLTQPYTPPIVPGVRVCFPGSQVIPTDTWTKILFWTVTHDTLNDWDAVNQTFVCSQAGYYLICANTRWQDIVSLKNIRQMVRINGLDRGCYLVTRIGGSGWPAQGVSDIHYLSVGDYVDLMVHHNSGANRMLAGSASYTTYLAIQRVG